MDRELARHVLSVGFHSLFLLESLISILEKHCDENEYNEYAKSIATVSAEMATAIFNKVFREHPKLETEVDQKIQKYGQFIWNILDMVSVQPPAARC